MPLTERFSARRAATGSISPTQPKKSDIDYKTNHENKKGPNPKAFRLWQSLQGLGITSFFPTRGMAANRSYFKFNNPKNRVRQRQRDKRQCQKTFLESEDIINVCLLISVILFVSIQLSHAPSRKQIEAATATRVRSLPRRSAVFAQRAATTSTSTRARTDNIELLINSIDGIGNDFFTDKAPIEALISSPNLDFGNLNINFMQDLEHGRKIHPNPQDMHGHVWTEDEFEDTYWEEYYAFDDDYVRNVPFVDIGKQCRRVSWHKLYNPNCNTVHEVELLKGDNRLLGEGSYREAYLLHERYDPDIIIKVNRFHNNPFNMDRYEFIRMDALVMERLTSSPRIVDIYGHCGSSVTTEYLPNELEEVVVPDDGEGEHLNDKDDVDPQNNYTISEQLDLAIQLAEALADLHGFKDGVLVHDDIQLAQYLFTPEGRLKLNDFNRAEAMLYDEHDGSYCRYQNGKGGGNYRAPEEYKDGRLNEKIDIWSMGNNIYALITGLWVFYDDKVKVMSKKIIDGETAYIDPRYRNRNYIHDNMIHIMERCWAYNPDNRPEAFEIVRFLREVKEKSQKLGLYEDTLAAKVKQSSL